MYINTLTANISHKTLFSESFMRLTVLTKKRYICEVSQKLRI